MIKIKNNKYRKNLKTYQKSLKKLKKLEREIKLIKLKNKMIRNSKIKKIQICLNKKEVKSM